MSKTALLRGSLDVLYYSGASHLLRRLFQGLGAIFMLHHVRPGGGLQQGFAPNSILEVTPEFLDRVIGRVKQQGYQLLNMQAAMQRLEQGEAGAPFAVFTLDDAYRDNLVHALPVFKRHACPFTIFASPAIQDGTCELWWRGLEAVIARHEQVTATLPDGKLVLRTETAALKDAAWARLYWPLRNMGQLAQRQWIRKFCDDNSVDLLGICRAEAMNWTELRNIAQEPLCEIGAHTVHHYAVSHLSEAEARRELNESAERLHQELGYRPRFFAYPYGDATSAGPRDFQLAREAGFEAAVTTRKGLVFPAHREHKLALPRLSLNGDYQQLRYVDALTSGTAFALFNKFRQLDVA